MKLDEVKEISKTTDIVKREGEVRKQERKCMDKLKRKKFKLRMKLSKEKKGGIEFSK
jgi:hypothetical protein